MPRTWIFIDVSNLAFRAFHTTGGLSYNGAPTGIIYGILREIDSLQNLFDTSYFAFAFDSRMSLRKKQYPWYKASREKSDPEFQESRAQVGSEIDRLREEILPALGYKNLFSQPGYEGDDIIASLCLNKDGGEEAVIVSSDADLNQLLTPYVRQYRPVNKTTVTYESFKRNNFGLSPFQLVKMKAISGCISDNVPGLEGVGEVYAGKYLAGLLKEGKVKSKIDLWVNSVQYTQNLRVCKVPYEGCKKFKATPHPAITWEARNQVNDMLGFASFKSVPVKTPSLFKEN